MQTRSMTGAGFTIVEVMIFLAISGLMFVLAINAMSGKQQQTEFQTGVGTLRSELNQDLSNVGDGNYTLPNNTHCNLNGSGTPTFQNNDTNPPVGTCTVIGEIISFNDTPVNGRENYNLFPIIGRTYSASTSQPATNLSQAIPQINTTDYNSYAMPFGLAIAQNDTAANISTSGGYGAIGLVNFTSFEGGTSTSNGLLNSGSQHVEIFLLPTSKLSDTAGNTQGIVNGTSGSPGLYNCTVNSQSDVCVSNGSNYAQINPSSGITFCVNSGTTQSQSALFTIGGGSNSTTSAVDQIYSSGDC